MVSERRFSVLKHGHSFSHPSHAAVWDYHLPLNTCCHHSSGVGRKRRKQTLPFIDNGQKAEQRKQHIPVAENVACLATGPPPSGQCHLISHEREAREHLASHEAEVPPTMKQKEWV